MFHRVSTPLSVAAPLWSWTHPSTRGARPPFGQPAGTAVTS